MYEVDITRVDLETSSMLPTEECNFAIKAPGARTWAVEGRVRGGVLSVTKGALTDRMSEELSIALSGQGVTVV